MLNQGKHPFYKCEDDEKSYVSKIASDQFVDYGNMSALSIDLFKKLCSRSLSDRYTVTQALKHPWITKRSEDSIPLTQGQEAKAMLLESKLR